MENYYAINSKSKTKNKLLWKTIYIFLKCIKIHLFHLKQHDQFKDCNSENISSDLNILKKSSKLDGAHNIRVMRDNLASLFG